MTHWILRLFQIAAFALTLNCGIAFADAIYYADRNAGVVSRARLDGSGIEVLVAGLNANYIDIDPVDGKLYWTMGDAIQRSNLDGSGVEDIVNTSLPSGIALDLAARKFYWLNLKGDVSIRRANLDGSDVQDLVLREDVDGNFRAIDLDVANGHMYWTDDGNGKVWRANLDGTNVEEIASTGWLLSPRGIDLDLVNRKVYWAQREWGFDTDTILRANLDGSGLEPVVDLTATDALVDVKLDVARGKMYWTDQDAGAILRANLDGTNIEAIITGIAPYGIVLDVTVVPEPTSLILFVLGGIGVMNGAGVRRWRKTSVEA